MDVKFITLTKENIEKEHICCVFSDEKSKESYELKKQWLKVNPQAENPRFDEGVSSGECRDKYGLVVYYSNRCPFTEYQVNTELTKTAENRNLPLKINKLTTLKEAQSAPTPANIFGLFYNRKFVKTDVSVCMDSRFDKIVKI
jgi:hypothetical protein